MTAQLLVGKDVKKQRRFYVCLPIAASDGGQGQYSVSILDGWLGSGGWAAGNLADWMTPSTCLLTSAKTRSVSTR